MALSTYNLLATLKSVLGSVHGVDKIAAGLSDFYLVDDIHGIYRGMMIAIPPVHWQCFEDCTPSGNLCKSGQGSFEKSVPHNGSVGLKPCPDLHTFFGTLTQLVDVLQHLATKVHLKSFRKHPRSPKKKRPPLKVDAKHPHCSTARKLKQYKAAQDAIP